MNEFHIQLSGAYAHVSDIGSEQFYAGIINSTPDLNL